MARISNWKDSPNRLICLFEVVLLFYHEFDLWRAVALSGRVCVSSNRDKHNQGEWDWERPFGHIDLQERRISTMNLRFWWGQEGTDSNATGKILPCLRPSHSDIISVTPATRTTTTTITGNNNNKNTAATTSVHQSVSALSFANSQWLYVWIWAVNHGFFSPTETTIGDDDPVTYYWHPGTTTSRTTNVSWSRSSR